MNYADWDGDGYPDHVMGPDGIWYAFDPATGEITGSPLGTASSEGNIPTGSIPTAFGGGTQGRSPAPTTPTPMRPPSGFGSSQQTVPTYRDGTTHPAMGGAPRVPGGRFAQQSAGYDNRQQVHVPGGPSAGPFNTSAAPSARASYSGGSADSGGGGGGLAKDMINRIRGHVMGKISGMGPGGSGSYNPYSYDSSYKPYEPDKLRLRGPWAKGMDSEQAQGLYGRPSMMLPRVSPSLDINSRLYGMASSLPMNELTMLTAGKKIKAPKVDEYGNLTSQDKSLSGYVNNLGDLYDHIVNREGWVDYDRMANNLMTARKKSALGAAFKGQPVGNQVGSLLNMTGALFGTTLNPWMASAYQNYASGIADQVGSRYLDRKAKRTPSIAKKIGREIFYQ